jgi:hypothetical protein
MQSRAARRDGVDMGRKGVLVPGGLPLQPVGALGTTRTVHPHPASGRAGVQRLSAPGTAAESQDT